MKYRLLLGWSVVMSLAVITFMARPTQAITTFSIESIGYDHYPVGGYYGENQITLSVVVLLLQLLVWVMWLILVRRAMSEMEAAHQRPWHTKFVIGLLLVAVNALLVFAYHPTWLHLAFGSPAWALGVACSPSRLVFAGIMSVIQGLLSVVAFFMLVVAHVHRPIQVSRVGRIFWMLIVVQVLMAVSALIQPMLPAC